MNSEHINAVEQNGAEQEPSEALRREYVSAWAEVVSGKEYKGTPPTSKEEIAIALKALIDDELEGHLEALAKQQGKELPPLSELSASASFEEQVHFLNQLVERTALVNRGESGGFVPYLSRELNGMDCTMSTWVLQHELKKISSKVGMKFEYGLLVGHDVGIATLANGDTYYVDGQEGFVEKIDTEEKTLPDDLRQIEVKNWQEVEARRKDFFPQYVFTAPYMDVAATMVNVDGMIFKQKLWVPDEEKMKEGEEARVAKELEPYARPYQEKIEPFASNVADSAGNVVSPGNEMMEFLFPAIDRMYNSKEFREDAERLRNTRF